MSNDPYQPYGQRPEEAPSEQSPYSSQPPQQWGPYGQNTPNSGDNEPEWINYSAPVDAVSDTLARAEYPTTPVSYPVGAALAAPPKRGGLGRGLLIGGAAFLVLIVGGAVAAYFLLLNRPALAVERALPANTLGYLTIDASVEGNQKAALDKMRAAFENQPGFSEAWAKITESLTMLGPELGGVPASGTWTVDPAATTPTPATSKLDDLSSYLGGNITISIMPPSTAQLEALQNGDMDAIGDVIGSNVVGLIDLDFNPLNKKGLLTDFKKAADDKGSLELTETYKDVEIRKWITGTNELYFALLNGTSTAVVGGKPDPVRAVIDEYKGDKGLASDENYKALQAQVPKDHVVSLYMNLGELYKQLSLALPESAQQFGGLSGAELLTVTALDDGLQIDIAANADYSNSTAPQAAQLTLNPNARPAVSIVDDVPANSTFFFAGSDLQTVGKALIAALPTMGPEINEQYTSMRDSMQQQFGLDLEQDILPILAGDYVLSGKPDTNALLPVGEVDLQIKLKEADRPKAAEVVSKLAQGINPATTSTSKGGDIWTLTPDSNMAVAGVIDDRVVTVVEASGGDALSGVDGLIGGRGQGLGTSDAWKAASKHLLADTNIILYADLSGLRQSFEGMMSGADKTGYEETFAPFVRPFKYVLVSSNSNAADPLHMSTHGVVFIGISQ